MLKLQCILPLQLIKVQNFVSWNVMKLTMIPKIGISRCTKAKSLLLGYNRPMSLVPCKYLKILLIAVRWESLWLAWNLTQRHTLSVISRRIIVKYSIKPIIHRCIVWSPLLASRSWSNLMDELLRVLGLFFYSCYISSIDLWCNYLDL